MFGKVIVAFDGSERALDALLLGEALTDADGELFVCCVHHYQALSARIDPTEPSINEETARESVLKAVGELHRGLKVTPLFVAGASAASALQRTALRVPADLIVIGSSHRGTMGRVFVGSITQETLHEAPCPVAVAPAGLHARESGARIERIVVGYDLVEPMPAGTAASVALCEGMGAELRVIAVAEDAAVADPRRATMPYGEITQARLDAAERATAAVLARLPSSILATSEVRDGAPAEQLLEATCDTDLLVLGSHGRGAMGRLIMGSVCDAVVRAAACPVLVIPPDVAGKEAPVERAAVAVT
jgi:nucleotide-binding universal stress UspA family protein